MSFNIDDPSTWDNLSTEELAQIADAKDDVAEPQAASQTEDVKAPVVPEAPVEQPAKEAPVKDEPALVLDDIPVHTKDGKHYIPHHVLAQTRSRAREAEARIQAMEAELEALRKAPQAPAVEQPQVKVEDKPVITPDIQARADKLRTDWGDDIADQYLQGVAANAEIAALKAQIQEQLALVSNVKNAQETEQATRQRTEAQQVQDAIDSVPALAAWQAEAEAGKSQWFEMATSLHHHLMNTDPKYQAKSWDERFAVLPQKMNALYDAPLAEVKAPQLSAEQIRAQAAAKLAAAESAAPRSLSDLPTGDVPAERKEEDKLDAMSPEEAQAYMQQLAANPDKFQAYLRSLA